MKITNRSSYDPSFRYEHHQCALLRGAVTALQATEQRIPEMFEQALNEDAVLLLDEADTFLLDHRDAQQYREVTQTNELLTQLECFDGIRTYALMTTVNYANCRCWCFGYDTVEDANFKAPCDSQMHLADVHGIFDE